MISKRFLSTPNMIVFMIVLIMVSTGLVWIYTDQIIAPPGLRVLDWTWRVFVCRCSI